MWICYSQNLANSGFRDLSYNDLTGPLPEFLSEMPNLNTLNVSGNNLTGSVPEALLQKFRDGKLALSVGENPDLCLSVPCKRKKKKEVVVPIVASSIAAVLVLLFIFSALVIYRRKRKGDMVTKSNIKSKNQQYSYSEVVSITNNFRTIIGGGGFGKVYLGKLKDETQVAVKLLSTSSNQGYKEFRAEAQLLMIVHHKNLVSLVGYCDEGATKALIYEYMASGNLLQHLSVTNTNVLTWNERIHIAVDAAHGLEYLHNGCKPPIIHRDLKPSNILLNEHMQAKIADFGLSRAFATENDSHVSTRPAGTLGYVDPEFQSSGNFNKKNDVYSFGIILFELITGRTAIVRGPVRNNHILDWVNPLIERGDVQNIIDPRLEGEFNSTSAWKAIEIAMSCIPSYAIQRLDMSYVLAELKECLALEMAHEITQRMATKGNLTTSNTPFKMTQLEYESDIVPHSSSELGKLDGDLAAAAGNNIALGAIALIFTIAQCHNENQEANHCHASIFTLYSPGGGGNQYHDWIAELEHTSPLLAALNIAQYCTASNTSCLPERSTPLRRHSFHPCQIFQAIITRRETQSTFTISHTSNCYRISIKETSLLTKLMANLEHSYTS
nr:putative leucine-rich repeat receptor-like serine/threonine-protein kinase [Quercus suber]